MTDERAIQMKRSKFLLVVFFIVTIIAVMSISKSVYPSNTLQNSMDLVLIVDISPSIYWPWIESDDIKNAIYEFVLNMPQNVSSISLTSFNGSTFQEFLKKPITTIAERERTAKEVIEILGNRFDKNKDSRLGTNIGGAILDAANYINASRPNSGTPAIVMLFTDAWNSKTTKGEYPKMIASLKDNYLSGDLIFYAIELRDEYFIDRYVNKKVEMHVDLKEIADHFSGSLYVVENINQVHKKFGEISEEIFLASAASATSSESTDFPVHTPDVPQAALSPLSIDIMMKAPAVDRGIGLLSGNGLRVQGQIINKDSNGIESRKSVYQEYEATLFIRKDGDEHFHEAVMNTYPTSYNLTMSLPEDGRYHFYIQLVRKDAEKEVVTESKEQEVIVYKRIPLEGIRIRFVDMPTSLKVDRQTDDGLTPFTLETQFTKSFSNDESIDDIFKLYYNEYTAIAYINPAESKEHISAYIMQTDGASYFVETELPGSGVYDYRVDLMDEEDIVIRSIAGTVTLIGPLYYIVTAVFFTIGIFCVVTIYLMWFKMNHFDFIITISNDENLHLLTFSTQMDFIGNQFSLKRLLNKNKNGTYITPIGGKFTSMQDNLFKDVYDDFASKNPIMFSVYGKEKTLTLTFKGKNIKLTGHPRLRLKDSISFPLELKGRAYSFTLLYTKKIPNHPKKNGAL